MYDYGQKKRGTPVEGAKYHYNLINVKFVFDSCVCWIYTSYIHECPC